MYKIQMLASDMGACSYYRTILPHIHLNEHLFKLGIQLDIGPLYGVDTESGHDLYLFMRIPPPYEYAHRVVRCSQVAKVVWDLDDDIPGIPDNSPVKKSFPPQLVAWLHDYITLANHVTVSTPYLKNETSKYFDKDINKISVLPNLIRSDLYSYFHPGGFRQYAESTPPVRVIVSGSISHAVDLPELIPAVQCVMNRDDATLFFYGLMPEELKSVDPRRVVEIRQNNLKHYPATLATIAPHIALLPLKDIVFNRSKSNIKYLEMTMAGAVCIASNVGPFWETIEDGVDGVLCNTPEEMGEALDRMIEDPEWRKRLFKKACEKVIYQYSWDVDNVNRRRWIDFFASIPSIIS